MKIKNSCQTIVKTTKSKHKYVIKNGKAIIVLDGKFVWRNMTEEIHNLQNVVVGYYLELEIDSKSKCAFSLFPPQIKSEYDEEKIKHKFYNFESFTGKHGVWSSHAIKWGKKQIKLDDGIVLRQEDGFILNMFPSIKEILPIGTIYINKIVDKKLTKVIQSEKYDSIMVQQLIDTKNNKRAKDKKENPTFYVQENDYTLETETELCIYDPGLKYKE